MNEINVSLLSLLLFVFGFALLMSYFLKRAPSIFKIFPFIFLVSLFIAIEQFNNIYVFLAGAFGIIIIFRDHIINFFRLIFDGSLSIFWKIKDIFLTLIC